MKTISEILTELELSDSSTIQEILEEFTLVTQDEINGIKTVSVKPLPNVVRDKATELKDRLVNVIIDDDNGSNAILNKRLALLYLLLTSLNGLLETNTSDIDTINSKIPSEATSSNQLADRDYVDTHDALKVNISDIKDNLTSTSTNTPLSANQGKILKGLIDAITSAISSNDSDLDTVQEIVTYIKENREDINDLLDTITEKADLYNPNQEITSGKVVIPGVFVSDNNTYKWVIEKGRLYLLKGSNTVIELNPSIAVFNTSFGLITYNYHINKQSDDMTIGVQHNSKNLLMTFNADTGRVDFTSSDNTSDKIYFNNVKLLNTNDVKNVLNDTSTNLPLSAYQGKLLKDAIDAINTLLTSDDTDLDTVQEIVTYIKSNKSIIETLSSNKINFTDIVDNLTSEISNKPLSAKQGYILKGFIDTINNAETGIQAAEALRVLAENARVEAEELRQQGYSTMSGAIESISDDVSTLQDGVIVDEDSNVQIGKNSNLNIKLFYDDEEMLITAYSDFVITDTINRLRFYNGALKLSNDNGNTYKDMATENYVNNQFATSQEIDSMLEEVFG